VCRYVNLGFASVKDDLDEGFVMINSKWYLV